MKASAVIMPISAGPFLVMFAMASSDTGASVTELLIHSTVPPPNKATRYTRYAASNHSMSPRR